MKRVLYHWASRSRQETLLSCYKIAQTRILKYQETQHLDTLKIWKNKECNNISLIDQEKVKENFSHDAPLPKPMSDTVKVDFLAHANIKVPAQEKQAYEE